MALPTDFKVGDFTIGSGLKPFIIAEMSGNHNQSLDRAFALVDAAAASGAHALKLQTYTADTMTIDLAEREFKISDPNSLWYGRSLYDLYQEAHTPWDWHKPIFERCKKYGMVGFSTPFDETAVDFLESLGVELYKIASFENTDIPLIRKVARTGKPMIISTGMASVAEIHLAVSNATSAGARDLVLLKCTSNYPASPENSNLRTIPHMRDLFKCHIGLSDHTLGIGAAVAATALGATVIEKHFTINRSDGGVDSAFSLEPNELAALVIETERAAQAMGEITYSPTDSEKASLTFRRSLYVVSDVSAGDIFSSANVRAIRPGLGLPPSEIDRVIGRYARQDIKRGTALSYDLIQ
jgi:pseudaminic acid synthase